MDNTKGLMAPGRGLPYKSDGDAWPKIKSEPLRDTNVGVAEP